MTQPHGEVPAGLNSKCEAGRRSQVLRGKGKHTHQKALQAAELAWGGRATTPRPPGPQEQREGEQQPVSSAWTSLSRPSRLGAGNVHSIHPGAASASPQLLPTAASTGPETQVVPNIRDELHANLSATHAGGSSSHRRTGWEPWTRSSPWETLADKQPVFSTCLNVWPRGICLGFQKLPCAMSPEPAAGPGGGSGQTNSPGITAALSRQPRLRHGDLRTLSTLETLSSMPASGSDTPKHRGHPNSPALLPSPTHWPPGQ